MGILLAISDPVEKNELQQLRITFPQISIIADTDCNEIANYVEKDSYNLIVFVSKGDSLPDSWCVDQLQLEHPVMILLNVHRVDMFVIHTFMDPIGMFSNKAVETAKEGSLLLHQSLVFIEENLYENDLSLEKAAASIFVSRCHYSRMFKTHIGIGFKEYLMNKRIEKARCMLQEGRAVTEVCYAVGYGDLTHFGRVFKRMVGVNPSEYRRVG